MNLDDIFGDGDARIEGCERMTTPHGWLQRRSALGWTATLLYWRGGAQSKMEQAHVNRGISRVAPVYGVPARAR